MQGFIRLTKENFKRNAAAAYIDGADAAEGMAESIAEILDCLIAGDGRLG